MRLRSILKGILIAVSYYTLRKTIDRFPPAYRKTAVFLLRLCVFLGLFLIVFSFFVGRIDIIGSGISVPEVFVYVLVGIVFVISIVIAFFLTAIIEEIYRKVSEVIQKAEKGAEEIKDKVKAPGNMAKKSIESTKKAVLRTGRVFTETSKKLYDLSLKGTNSLIDSSASFFKRKFRK